MAKPPRKGRAHDEPEGVTQDEARPQTMEEAADRVDDTPAPAPEFNSVLECAQAIDRHVAKTHGLTSDKEFMQKVATYLHRVQMY